MIYTMMQACEETGMTYQGLKFYWAPRFFKRVALSVASLR